LAVLFFVGALVFPIIGLIVGWLKWDALVGFIIMTAIFLVMCVVGGLLLFSVKDLTWVSVYIPYIFSALYGFLPDAIPLSIDDAAATTAGAVFSFVLALRKNPQTPKWIFIPLLVAGIYALAGGTIPGGFDEAIVDILALIIAWIGTRQGEKKAELEEPKVEV
jgi:hypothetical protein